MIPGKCFTTGISQRLNRCACLKSLTPEPWISETIAGYSLRRQLQHLVWLALMSFGLSHAASPPLPATDARKLLPAPLALPAPLPSPAVKAIGPASAGTSKAVNVVLPNSIEVSDLFGVGPGRALNVVLPDTIAVGDMFAIGTGRPVNVTLPATVDIPDLVGEGTGRTMMVVLPQQVSIPDFEVAGLAPLLHMPLLAVPAPAPRKGAAVVPMDFNRPLETSRPSAPSPGTPR
jgi:hypothetical protein